MIRGVAIGAAVAAMLVPLTSFGGTNPGCRSAIPSNERVSVNGESADKYNVVQSSVLNAIFPGGGIAAGFAYVYKTQGAGLYLNDSANRLTVPLQSADVKGLTSAYATMQKALDTEGLGQNGRIPISLGASSVLFGSAQLSVDTCPAGKS